MKTLEPILAEHPFFKNLEPAHLTIVTGCASNVRFDAGAMVFQQDEEANTFYILRQGKVALEVCPPAKQPITVQTLSDGDILGWSWLIPPYHWHFDARAVELTRAVALDGKCLRNKCEQDHSLGYELLSRLLPVVGKSMEATQHQLLDVYGIDH